MYDIDGIDELRARVKVLEQQKAAEWKEMKDRVNDQYDRLKPANLIRNAFEDLTGNLNQNLNADGDMLKDGAALLSGMVVNAMMSGSKNKSLKKWLTFALFSIATYFITRHREEIVEAGHKVMDFVSDKLDQMKQKAGERAERRRAKREAEAEAEDYDETTDLAEDSL